MTFAGTSAWATLYFMGETSLSGYQIVDNGRLMSLNTWHALQRGSGALASPLKVWPNCRARELVTPLQMFCTFSFPPSLVLPLPW